MAAVVVEVADAVAAALNAATLSQPFTAERTYLLTRELPEAAGLKVTVVPAGYALTAIDLTPRFAFDAVVEVWVQQRAAPANGEVDPLVLLAEEVAGVFGVPRLPGYPRARCTGVAVLARDGRPLAADRDALEELRTFTSVVSLTFRVTR